MAQQELSILLATVAGFILGGWHLCWIGAAHNSSKGLWCRRLGVGAVLWLGATGLVAAALQSPGIVPVGLGAGLFMVIMLLERPFPLTTLDN